MRRRRTLAAHQIRALSVDAGCDPRSIVKVYQGEVVTGLPGERARAALERAGLLPASDTEDPKEPS